MGRGVLLYTDDFLTYDLGEHHPLRPARLVRTYELLSSYGALLAVDVVAPQSCTAQDLRSTHDAEYIEAVERLSYGEHVPFPFRYGFDTGDNPVFPGMWEASLLYTGASLQAAQMVNDGHCAIAMNIAGGLHHAHYDRAAGFCVFNDCVVAIHKLKEKFDRVAYVDVDVHHADGVQEAFYDDPSVLTISVHETGRTLYPGTGFVTETGIREGTGFSVNVPLWPYTTDEMYLRAWREAVMPILHSFDPQAICLEAGTDAHYLDPLARLCLTAQGWTKIIEDVQSLDRPMVVLGGGGYNQHTVPRMWTLAFSRLFHVDLPDDTPDTYAYHGQIPYLTDHEVPPVAGHDLDRAEQETTLVIDEVKRLLFGRHGL